MNRREFGLSTLGLAAFAGAADPKPPRMSLLVPAYFYPGGDGRKAWDGLIGAASRAPVVAIANPASGPGATRDPNYTKVLDRARREWVTLIGYISTLHGKRPVAEARADMDLWPRLYPQIRGFFLDEQASDPAKLALYEDLSAHGRKVLPGGKTVANPGTICDEAYIARKTSDVACLFEHFQGYDAFRPPAWAAKYEPGRFAVIPYAIDGVEGMRRAIRDAASRRIGWIFVTDHRGANPYDRLPSYWEDEVKAVAAMNAAS